MTLSTPSTVSKRLQPILPWVLALLAFGLRMAHLHTLGWYPDEGAFTELALTLWRHGLPSIGAVKQTALLPMGCSWLAPALAAPWAGLAGSAIIGVRLWTAVLAAATAIGLAHLGRTVERPWLGLAAAGAYAAWPLAVRLGAWSTYHHLAAALTVLSALQAARFSFKPERQEWLKLCWAMGLTLAAAYWVLWLAFLPLGLALRAERRAWLPAGLFALLTPLAVVFALGYSADPASFGIDLQTLTHITHADLPAWLQRIAPLYSLWMVFKSFPPFALGFAGLLLLAWQALREQRLSPATAAALALFLGCADVFRQRQNLEGFAYPLVLALPAACFGLGAFIDAALRSYQARQPRWILAPAFIIAAFWPQPRFQTMDQLCARPAPANELLAKAGAELKAGDLVIGQAPLDWGFPAGVNVCQFDDLAVMNGEAVAFLPSGLPKSRFVFQAALQDAKWIVVSPYTQGFTFTQPACLLLGLQAEQLGFYKAWSNGTYDVYENPRFTGKRPAFAERMLGYYNLYDQAAADALARSDLPLARFALLQGMPYQEGDVAGRKRALAMVEDRMGIRR